MSTPLTITPAQEERRKVGMLVPPPVLLAVLGKVALVLQMLVFGGLHVSTPGALVGGLVIAASAGLIAACTRLFQQAGTPVRPTSPSTAIVKRGAYRYSRHPMYLGMAGLLVGAALLLGSVAYAVAAAVFVVIVDLGVARREERYLQAVHGDAYRRYAAQVRRWI